MSQCQNRWCVGNAFQMFLVLKVNTVKQRPLNDQELSIVLDEYISSRSGRRPGMLRCSPQIVAHLHSVQRLQTYYCDVTRCIKPN